VKASDVWAEYHRLGLRKAEAARVLGMELKSFKRALVRYADRHGLPRPPADEQLRRGTGQWRQQPRGLDGSWVKRA
jgi:hypothetical protein